MDIVLLGAQGSGKGNQAQTITRAFHLQYIASGSLFRQALQEGTELGLKAKDYLEHGELVPDEMTIDMVLSYIRAASDVKGVLLDGFPRTISQAEALDEKLEEMGRFISCAIYIAVPREELLRRLSGRYLCHAQGHVYNILTNPPRVPGICDIDGSELYQRDDDREEAIQKRLDIFFTQTIKLLDYYGHASKLIEINGDQSIAQVSADIIEAVNHATQGKQGNV